MNEQENEFSEKSIRKDLAVRRVGRSVIYHETLPSTMDAAREAARNGVLDGTVVVTGSQTRGRGRLQRAWQTPPGNIALSIVLYPDAEALPYLIMMASLAAARGIEAVTGLDAAIKWPNDVLVNGRKACGILIENEVRTGRPATAIVGIGINTDLDPVALGEVITPATSLATETGGPVSRTEIMQKLLESFDGMWGPDVDRKAIYEDWKQKLVTLGQPVTVTWKDTMLEGTAEDVDESGALVVRTDDGELTTVVAGDVSLRMAEAPVEEEPEQETGEEPAGEAGEAGEPEFAEPSGGTADEAH